MPVLDDPPGAKQPVEVRPWLLVCCLAALPLLGWWSYGLFDLDEGFYAAVAAEMNRRGEWITPYYNGSPWFEKPILLYWLAKPSLAIFGEMVGPRLPSVLAAMGTYAAIAFFARRWMGELAAMLSVLVLATSLLWVAAGRMMLTDPLLTLCFSGAMLTFWASLVGEGRTRLWTAALLGLAVLAKGPVALILFALIAGITYWRERELRANFRGWWLLGTLVLASVVAAWYVPAFLATPDLFVQKFLIEQNVGRFTGGDAAHSVRDPFLNLIFYPLILLLGMLPWSVLLLRKQVPSLALRRITAGRRPESPDAEIPAKSSAFRRYLWTWAAAVVVFFMVSAAKLPHYVLPASVPLAMLTGGVLADSWKAISNRRWLLMGSWSVVLALFVQWGFSSYYYGARVAGQELPGFHFEVHRLARYVRANAAPSDLIAVYQMPRRSRSRGTGRAKIQETSHPSILLYLDRTVVESDSMDELAQKHRTTWIITRWNRRQPADYAIVRRHGARIEPVPTPFEQDLYRLYRLVPKTAGEGSYGPSAGVAPVDDEHRD